MERLRRRIHVHLWVGVNAAGELIVGSLAIAVGWGLFRAVEAWQLHGDFRIIEAWRIQNGGGDPEQRDWGLEMQVAAERHLAGCNDAMWLEEEGVDVETPAEAPFCGCGTCTVREVLVAAWPVMQQMILEVSDRSDIEFSLTTKRHPDE